MPKNNEPAPFIASQRMRMLVEMDDPRPYLLPEYFRACRQDGDGQPGDGQTKA